MSPLRVYRIEKKVVGTGMWYNHVGAYTYELEKICPDAKALQLDMCFDPHFFHNNKIWFSSVGSIEQLLEWFSIKDIEDLLANGFILVRLEVGEYQSYENQIIFTKESVISHDIISLEMLKQLIKIDIDTIINYDIIEPGDIFPIPHKVRRYDKMSVVYFQIQTIEQDPKQLFYILTGRLVRRELNEFTYHSDLITLVSAHNTAFGVIKGELIREIGVDK